MLTQNELHDKLKRIVWSVKVVLSKDEESEGTGFSVHADGLIMTCAHLFRTDDYTHIEVNQPFGVVYQRAERVYYKPEWDIALLKVKGVNCECVEFALDDDISVGDPLIHMGDPFGLVASYMCGYAAYRCVADVPLPSMIYSCENYEKPLFCRPDYRILGEFMNQSTLSNWPDCDFKSYEAYLPVIQCGGFSATSGCSGGPVVNSRGALVGILSYICGNYGIAIHVKAIKHVLDAYISTFDDSGPSRIEDVQGKKDRKGKGKGKGKGKWTA